MNYLALYDKLCYKAKSESSIRIFNKKNNVEYYESHHILPKCLGGVGSNTNYDHENIVLLTPKEHYLAHLLLIKIHPHENKLKYAMWAMLNLKNKYHEKRISIKGSRSYDIVRKEFISLMSNRNVSDDTKQKHRDSWTLERRQSHSKKMSGQNNPSVREDVKLIKREKMTGSNNPMFGLKGKDNPNYGQKRPSVSGENNCMKNPEIAKKISEQKKEWWRKKKENQSTTQTV